jgi:anaerobic selenocysteine-containing dehydrogenase
MMAAALGLDHPALGDSDEVLLATYLDGYDTDTVQQLHEQGWVKVRPPEDDRVKVMLRSDAMARMGLDPLPDALDGPGPATAAEPAGTGPAPDEEALLVLTPKSHHFLNSTAVNHQRLRVMAGEPSVLVAAVDADARGLADGQLACLRSVHGSLTVPVHRSDDVLPGTAVLLSNWWANDFPGGTGANAITGQELTDLGGAPRFQVRAHLTAV